MLVRNVGCVFPHRIEDIANVLLQRVERFGAFHAGAPEFPRESYRRSKRFGHVGRALKLLQDGIKIVGQAAQIILRRRLGIETGQRAHDIGRPDRPAEIIENTLSDPLARARRETEVSDGGRRAVREDGFVGPGFNRLEVGQAQPQAQRQHSRTRPDELERIRGVPRLRSWPAHPTFARLRSGGSASSARKTFASSSSTTSLAWLPKRRSASLRSSASFAPTTAMTGIFCRECSRIL